MNFAPRNASILSRLDRYAQHPAQPDLKKAAEQCLAIAQSFANERDELAQDRRYSPEGKREKLQEARAAATRRMQEARGPIDRAAQGVERLRGQIKPAAPVDRTDAVAEMRRAELRTYVRNIPDSLLRSAAILSDDPTLRDAVLDQPAFLSGVPELDYAKAKAMRDKQLWEQQKQLPAFRDAEALQAVIDEAIAAAGVANHDLS